MNNTIDYEKSFYELEEKVAKMLVENRQNNWHPDVLLLKWDDIRRKIWESMYIIAKKVDYEKLYHEILAERQQYNWQPKTDCNNIIKLKNPLCEVNHVLSGIDPLIDVGGDTIDLRKVERVGKVAGDSSWLEYTVYFTGGGEMKIYEDRESFENTKVRQMKRKKFVELWLSSKQIDMDILYNLFK